MDKSVGEIVPKRNRCKKDSVLFSKWGVSSRLVMMHLSDGGQGKVACQTVVCLWHEHL